MLMVLDKILQSTRRRLHARKAALSLDEGSVHRLNPERDFLAALQSAPHTLIAEYKSASPSEGAMESPLTLEQAVGLYNRHADAISILTEEEHFHGSLDDLSRASRLSTLPVMRKDFIIDPYQILEALHYGADAVLLIADILSHAELSDLYHLAEKKKIGVLMESHSEEALERALSLNPPIVGINNRNLDTLATDICQTIRLAGRVPPSAVLVSESGFKDPMCIEEIKPHARAFLIGTAFMKAPDPASALKAISRAVHDERGDERP